MKLLKLTRAVHIMSDKRAPFKGKLTPTPLCLSNKTYPADIRPSRAPAVLDGTIEDVTCERCRHLYGQASYMRKLTKAEAAEVLTKTLGRDVILIPHADFMTGALPDQTPANAAKCKVLANKLRRAERLDVSPFMAMIRIYTLTEGEPAMPLHNGAEHGVKERW